jgi:hypothetical protein
MGLFRKVAVTNFKLTQRHVWFWCGNLRRKTIRNIGVDGTTILKYIFKM